MHPLLSAHKWCFSVSLMLLCCAYVVQEDCEKLAGFLEEELGKHWDGSSASASVMAMIH